MQIDNLNKTRDILQNEITALAAKDVSVAHQLELTRKEFDTISSLVTKGLTVLPRQLAVEQDISQYESSRLDLQLAQLRAKQDISRIDRDILDLKDKRRASALAESRETQAKLMTLDEQIKTAQSLAEDTENHAPEIAAEADQDRPSAPIYMVTRVVDGTARTDEVKETDAVLPGDTLRVSGHRDQLLLSQQP